MRKHADWMAHADERVLEFLDERGHYQPAQIARELGEVGVDMDFHPGYIGRRCRMLRQYGFLENLGNGVYGVTERGEAFLAGELDAGTIEAVDDQGAEA